MSKVTMNVSQWEQLKEQYCEIVVDSMDMKSLIIYAQEQMVNYMDSLSYKELKEEVDNYDSDLFDELVDNVTQQYPKQVNNFGG